MRIWIDNEPQHSGGGYFQLSPYQGGPLERSSFDNGLFTFFATKSQGGQAVGLQEVSAEVRGVVRITFTPEYEEERPISKGWDGSRSAGGNFRGGFGDDDTLETTRSFGGATRSYQSGGTGLSGQSSQRFGQARLINEDESQMEEIIFRLVYSPRQDGPRPLRRTPPPVRD